MGSASCGLSQIFWSSKLGVELVTLGLSTVVLPIGRIGVRERAIELLDKCLVRFQAAKLLLCLVAPVHTSVLLARATNAADTTEGGLLLLKPLQHKVQSLEPHGYGGENLTLGLVGLHAFLDAIFGSKVAVEIDLGVRDNGEVGLDDDS